MSNGHNPLALEENQQTLNTESKRIKNLNETEKEDYKWLISDKRGRRILQRLIDFTGVNKCVFTSNEEMQFNSGMRNVGLAIQAKSLEASPENYFLMLQEYTNGRSSNS